MSEYLHYWDESPADGYTAEEEKMVKEPNNKVEDALFAFIISLMY